MSHTREELQQIAGNLAEHQKRLITPRDLEEMDHESFEQLSKRQNRPSCTTCGNQYDPDDIPGTHPYRHPVNGPLVNPTKVPEGPATVQLLSDPILRMILIEKGLISVLDITQAEDRLRASGMAISNPVPGSQGWRQEREGNWTPPDKRQDPKEPLE